MGSTGRPLQWAALLTPPTTRRGNKEQPKSACDFSALSRSSSTPRFRLHLRRVSRVSVESAWLGDARRWFHEEGNTAIHHPTRPNRSANSSLVHLCSCHEVEPCTKSQPPRAFSSFFFFRFSQVEPKPPSKVSWLLTSTRKPSRKRWWECCSLLIGCSRWDGGEG